MGGKTKEGAQLTGYLLGEGSESERERFEAEYFTDEDAFQEMLTAEDDLIDAYARGELSASERNQFEKRFLNSSEGRERVKFARALAASAPVAAPKVTGTTLPGFFASILGPSMALRAAMATVAIAAVVGFSWLLVERSRMNAELRELRAERETFNQRTAELQRVAEAERARTGEVTAQLDDLQQRIPDQAGERGDGSETSQQAKSSPAGKVRQKEQITARRGSKREEEELINSADATLGGNFQRRAITTFFPLTELVTLTPGSTRGGAGNTLTVHSDSKFFVFRLGLETEAVQGEYRASIETADGRSVWSVDSFKPREPNRASVDLPAVPAKDLPPGDYILFLNEKRANGVFENVASYSFRVVRK